LGGRFRRLHLQKIDPGSALGYIDARYYLESEVDDFDGARRLERMPQRKLQRQSTK
jgi:hypothetical protein